MPDPAALRIAHFSDTFLPRRDGVITSIRTLAGALGSRGHESVLFAPGYPDATPVGFPVVGLSSVPCGVADLRLATWPRSRSVERVADAAPDLVHVHTPGPAGLLGVLAAQRLGLPLVQTYHTDLHAYLEAYRIPTTALRVLLTAYRRRLGVDASPAPRRGLRVVRGAAGAWRPERRSAARGGLLDAANAAFFAGTDVVVVPTGAVLRRSALPVDPARIVSVPTGVAPRAVAADAGRGFRDRYGIPADAPLVLFVGRVNREKNVEALLAAVAEVAVALPTVRVALVGAVYEQRWLAGLLRTHGVGDRVVITGQLPAAAVAEAYAAADVFAFPSLTDTQGLVLQEAALAGVPVVMADSVLHAHGPLAGAAVCASGDGFAAAITAVLSDGELATRTAVACRTAALRHTPEAYGSAIEAVYRRALAERRAPLPLRATA
ncbi:glycosyltransferase [Cryptosporangium aurantiacum]|uniref:Glycosyltransferase involved in cell wall bisynthesis n=1 Tax=Cryptosporangium aurantiacum TaxID=134849 RepID=A0A1M7RGP3_9ACTN|nr:glycosyltransferase [Cryptosporangium aurantiacum]SHN45427.1 Glycosyltransferase involved in cell wall bisynthesis [Cryptosporangium aurantiacum]